MSFDRRAARARWLAGRHPEARELLEFYAALAEFQARARPDDLEGLKELVLRVGPQRLAEAASGLDTARWRRSVRDYLSGRDRDSAASFFARVLLQIAPPEDRPVESGRGCPRCGHAPQAGSLREEGHGTSLWLVCSLCFGEWRWPRGHCVACGETDEKAVSWYRAEEIPHVQLRACESCSRYVLVVRGDEDPAALPEVDEMAAPSLDVWARERGYVKVQPNLAGI